MTPQAKALRSAVAAAVGPGKVDAVLRAVVNELGVTEDDVELVQMWIDAKKSSDQLQGFVARMEHFRDRISALLEASGADR